MGIVAPAACRVGGGRVPEDDRARERHRRGGGIRVELVEQRGLRLRREGPREHDVLAGQTVGLERVERRRERQSKRLELGRPCMSERMLTCDLPPAKIGFFDRTSAKIGLAITFEPSFASLTSPVTYARYVVLSSSGAMRFHWSCWGDVCGVPSAVGLERQLRQGAYSGVGRDLGRSRRRHGDEPDGRRREGARVDVRLSHRAGREAVLADGRLGGREAVERVEAAVESDGGVRGGRAVRGRERLARRGVREVDEAARGR